MLLTYCKKKTYSAYLYFLHKRLLYCKSVYDLVLVFRNIHFFMVINDSDRLLTILIDCIKQYPLPVEKYQLFSILQQTYDGNLGIENYVSLIMWLAIVQVTNEFQPKLK